MDDQPGASPLDIARTRIAEEAERRTGVLSLFNLGLEQLPDELFELTHLRELNLGAFPFEHAALSNEMSRDFQRLSAIKGLEKLSVASRHLAQLDFVENFTALTSLDCSYTKVSDLAALASLTALTFLDCCDTQVCDLAPLSDCPALSSLICGRTQVSDLAPLAGLNALAYLDCRHTLVRDLAPLMDCIALTTLVCSRTEIAKLAPLEHLTNLTHLDCRGTQVRDLTPLDRLTNLTYLDIRDTKVRDLAPLAGLGALAALGCSRTTVSCLTPIISLTAMTHLECSGTKISDLVAIAGLTALTSLDCSRTKVSDLAPLAGLNALTSLECSGTKVSDLTPLGGLTALTSLDCSRTKVSDLTPLAGLNALTSLGCSGTRVDDLAPLAGLDALTYLGCSRTKVSDLAPLAGLNALSSLECSETKVSNLAPLTGLTALADLDFSGTKVSNLTPLAGLTALTSLDCSECQLLALRDVIYLAKLHRLIAFETFVPGIPHGVLSTSPGRNCLAALRAHFADQTAESAELPLVKLLLLGNGGTGKTQVSRWLAGLPFEQKWDSTHGIRVAAEPHPDSIAGRLQLRMWDFGGQDIYHGTHALFLRGPAILMPVWARDRENSDTYEHEGLTFRNHPLAYWLEVAWNQTSPDNPVLVVQNKCDSIGDEARAFPIAPETLTAFEYATELRVSPKAGRGRGHLEEALADAIAWMRSRHGTPRIGAGRLRVQHRLEALRDADMTLPPTQRRHRLMEREDFDAICAEEGGVSSTDHLLAYLDANGTLIHRPGLFGGRIILDQGWALDAIYAVFDRKNVYKVLRADEGRFTRTKLGLLVWQQHSDAERELLLGMMGSCGMCFAHRRAEPDEDTEYIAPDLLPDRAAVADRFAWRWDEDRTSHEATFRYPLLHDGLIRTIMAEIGELAAADALYWRGGLCAFEVHTRSRLMVESLPGEGGAGTIRVRTQDGQAGVLVEQTIEIVKRAQARLGMTSTSMDRVLTVTGSAISIGAGHASLKVEERPATSSGEAERMSFGQQKPPMHEWYVSYAWGDKSPGGRKRERIVNRLCDDATAKGLAINRDRNVLRLGDNISDFMRRIGAGDRIFVILSDKYLRSPYCMFELIEVWRTSKQDVATFLSRTRVYALHDAKIFGQSDPVDWGIYWKQEHDALEAKLRQHGHGVGGDVGHRQLTLMQNCYTQVADILDALVGMVQPRTIKQLEEWGFGDAPEPDHK